VVVKRCARVISTQRQEHKSLKHWGRTETQIKGILGGVYINGKIS
jgi:hypothetical protein